jgi:hypothetical protein
MIPRLQHFYIVTNTMKVPTISNAAFKIFTVTFMAWREDHVRFSVTQTRGVSAYGRNHIIRVAGSMHLDVSDEDITLIWRAETGTRTRATGRTVGLRLLRCSAC